MGMFDFLTNNKELPGKLNFKKYSGYTPPHVSDKYFRPIESMISETLMRRSQGQDVGYDPKRREELQGIYDIDFNRQQESNKNDLMNQLSGTGQSKNLAARDALLGQSQRYGQDTRSKYLMGLDVEDLTRRADDTKDYTRMLQDQNQINFGQENQVADFGLRQYGAENSAENAFANTNLQRASQYENPWGAALKTAANIGGMVSQFGGMGGGSMGSGGYQMGDMAKGQQGGAGSTIGTSSGYGVRKGFTPATKLRA